MFDIGFSELLLVAVIALLVVGPKRLPEAVRAWGRWTARARRAIEGLREEVEQELDLEDLRRIGEEFKREASGRERPPGVAERPAEPSPADPHGTPKDR